MKLSKRLETIVNQAAKAADGGRVADVGTDHGFVPIALVKMGAASGAIAMDVRKGPLKRAEEHIGEQGLSDVIEARLSDGLAKLEPGEADTVIIAGMGGELMLRILKDGGHVRSHIRRWILSPQSELSLFRHGLEELGLAVTEEVMVEEEGKYYVIITAEPGQMHWEEEFRYRYGDFLIRSGSPELYRLLCREQKQYEEIARQLSGESGEGARVRLYEIKEELKQIKEALYALQRVD